MDKEKAVMAVVLGVAVAAIIGFVLYTLWDNQRTHERHVGELSGTFTSSVVHADLTMGVLG